MNANAKPRELVFLTHGLGGNRWLMKPLERYFRTAGFETVNWGYRSLLGHIEDFAQQFRQRLQAVVDQSQAENVHIITHSMGGIVARTALTGWAPDCLRRIVMLCPPNHGSPVARRIAPWVRPISPSFEQISDEPSSFVNQLDTSLPQRCELGVVIAAGDFVVAPESTRLPAVADYITLPGRHSALLFSQAAAMETLHFVRHGQFAKGQIANEQLPRVELLESSR